jgi:hypothetical protein
MSTSFRHVLPSQFYLMIFGINPAVFLVRLGASHPSQGKAATDNLKGRDRCAHCSKAVSSSFITVNSIGSTSGLLLVDIPNVDSNSFNANANESLWRCVCNPLTKSFFRLPTMLSISVVIYRVIFIVEIKNNYKVIMVGKYSIKNTMVVEVYNYEKIYWRIDGNLPASSLEARNEQIIICIVGFVLCMAASGPLKHAVIPIPNGGRLGECRNQCARIFKGCRALVGLNVWEWEITCALGHIQRWTWLCTTTPAGTGSGCQSVHAHIQIVTTHVSEVWPWNLGRIWRSPI